MPLSYLPTSPRYIVVNRTKALILIDNATARIEEAL